MDENGAERVIALPADKTINAVTEAIAPISKAMGFRILRVNWGTGKSKTLQVMAENADGGMTVDECADLSRAISAVLDVEDPVASAYVLEVTSPGIDRPLISLADFQAHVGHKIKLRLNEPQDGRKTFRGTISSVDERSVQLACHGGANDGDVSLPFDQVSEAKLILTDELIAQSLKRGKRRNDVRKHKQMQVVK